MDKYEYKIKSDEIKQLIAEGDYAQAAEIADTIDWRRVKSVMMLCTISDLYKINRRYEDARDMLLLAYERRPGGRTICYSLCELSIKMEDFLQAVEYYKEFVQVAPKDSGRFVLQYKLYEAQDVSLEERIEVLEELKKYDYREKWAYELAYLYHRVGLATRCVEECDELILWFGEGKYVIKAMELKMLHEPLTAEQQEKYDNRFEKQQEYQKQPQTEAESQEYASSETYETENNYEGQYEEQYAAEDAFAYGEMQDGQAGQQETLETAGNQTSYEQAQADGYSQTPDPVEEMDIHVKTMDVGQYNTINLQAELAAGLKEVLGENQNPITSAIVAPMLQGDTGVMPTPLAEETEANIGTQTEEMESEVFFGETGELADIQEEQTEVLLPEEEAEAEPASTMNREELPKEASKTDMKELSGKAKDENRKSDITADIVMEQMRLAQAGEAKEQELAAQQVLAAQPPKELAGVLSQESDGQISLVMPESTNLEKQITGQMSIEDILAEWERMKKENEEKRKEEVRQHVLQQTGTMFTEFEASVRDGLLEQLENGAAIGGISEAEESEEEGLEEEEIEELEEIEDGQPEEEEIEEAEEIEDVQPEEEEIEEAEEIEDGQPEEEEIEEFEEIEDVQPEEEEAGEFEEIEAVQPEEEETEESEEIEDEQPEEEEAGGFEEIEDVQPEEETEEVEEPEEDEFEELESELPKKEQAEATEKELLEEPKKPVKPSVDKEEVSREPAKLRALTREEKELYAPFIQSRSSREQLIRAVDNITMAAYTGNLIITGEEGTNTLGLAKNVVREIQVMDSNFSGKVAKISGSTLNKKDVKTTINQLKNGALIIEKASEITGDTAQKMYKCLQQESLGIVLILEDNKKSMNRFLAANEQLAEAFTARIDVEALSNDALVAFGKQYAKEREYTIDDLGILALHTRIEDMQTSDHAVTVLEVKEIVDEAIHHADKKTLGHFFDVLLAKRYDEEDMIILTEKDFV